MTPAVNFTALVPWLALLSAASALLAWQFKAEPGKARGWLGMSAISLELLAAGLAVHWAIANAEGAFKVLFIAGVIGLAVAKATLFPGLVLAYRNRAYGALTVGFSAAVGAYLTVYALGAMSGLDTDSAKAAEAVARSAPLQAIDSEIQATRDRLQSLAGFADAGKAHAETQAVAQAEQSRAARAAELENAITAALSAEPNNRNGKPAGKSLDGLTAGCTNTASWYARYCAQVDSYRRELAQLQRGGAVSGPGYATQHDEYNGVQQHLTALENRRAQMLTGDSTAVAGMAVGASDRMLGWLFGLTEERARALKWLLLVAVFDLLSAAIRMFSEMMHGDDVSQAARRRFAALLSGGLTPVEAASVMGGSSPASASSIPPAQVAYTGQPGGPVPLSVPALDVGGHVLADGLALVHAGERVLRKDEVDVLQSLLHRLSNSAAPPLSDSTLSNSATPPLSDSTLSNSATPPLSNSTLSNSATSPLSNSTLSNSATSPLSDSGLSNRRKGVSAPCTDCGTLITLVHRNHLRCDACRDKYERAYRVRHASKT